jgi:hypothetical protein
MTFFPKQQSSRVGKTQMIHFHGKNHPIENSFGADTYQVRLVADEACCYRIGDGEQTATIRDVYLPKNVIEYVIVSPGQRISTTKASEQGGALWVTEMS